MILIFFFFVISVIILIERLIYFLRNSIDGRLLLFKLIGLIKNIRVIYVTEPSLAQEVLKVSVDKGVFLENLVAMDAWRPIISLESVNGEEWVTQKKLFIKLQQHLPTVDKLKISIKKILSKYPNDYYIDSIILSNIVVEIFIDWLFDIEFKEEWSFLAKASIEWRKEIAMKGKGDDKIKYKTIELFLEIIKNSRYYSLFGEKWNEPLYYSLFMQPFIISPMINISDIAVIIKKNPKMTILQSIHNYHPFPVLERYIDKDMIIDNKIVIKKNTQVFIPLDLLGKKYKYEEARWTPFGVGIRQCAGQQYAIILMNTLFENLKQRTNYYPEINHKYSGRNNDDCHIDIKYFIKRILEIIYKSIKSNNI